MRVFAFDGSGSACNFIDQMVADARSISTDPKDMAVMFIAGRVSKAQLLSEFEPSGWFWGGGDGTWDVLEWMEARHLQPTDELIMYHDGFWGFKYAELNMYERWYTVKLRLMKNHSIDAEDNLLSMKIDTTILPF